MSEPKYPEPYGSPAWRRWLRQFQRNTVLACAEEVGHDHVRFDDKDKLDCPGCTLLARAERMK